MKLMNSWLGLMVFSFQCTTFGAICLAFSSLILEHAMMSLKNVISVQFLPTADDPASETGGCSVPPVSLPPLPALPEQKRTSSPAVPQESMWTRISPSLPPVPCPSDAPPAPGQSPCHSVLPTPGSYGSAPSHAACSSSRPSSGCPESAAGAHHQSS